MTLLPFYLLLHRIKALVTMAKSVTSASRGKEDKTMPDESEVAVPPVPESCRSSDLMDGGLEDIQVPALMPQITEKIPGPVTAGTIVKLAEKLDLGAPALLDGGSDNLGIPTLTPKRSATSFPRATCGANNSTIGTEGQTKVVPWNGKIRWAIEGPSIFDDEEDELGAFYFRPNLLARHPSSDIWMFQYGLRYIPSKDDGNVYRTVRIENIPPTVTLKDILPAVSAEIFLARLANTIPITGSQTALITFVWQCDAVRFSQTSKAGINFGHEVAKVVPVNTPTYPISAELKRLIFKEGYTRCLCVANLRETLKSEIRRVMEKSSYSHDIEKIEDGLVLGETYIRFHSIKVSAAAYELLKNHRCFTQCDFKFLKKDRDTGGTGSEERNFRTKVQESHTRIGIWD
ncbi:hypothetical protein ETB97_000729 [Aspergillus alliaceus]|uniref:Uncharacterized protein n=1 Tax=Petromyces alliaceus TaxID=209559 RepID=A0A8H6AFT2_PETAA|nr:hypothetical protein ETB97_000729 [Aspergillus burnettii]